MRSLVKLALATILAAGLSAPVQQCAASGTQRLRPAEGF